MAWAAPALAGTGRARWTVYSDPADYLAGAPSHTTPTVIYVSSSGGDNLYDGLHKTFTSGTSGPKKYCQDQRTMTLSASQTISAGSEYRDSSFNGFQVLEDCTASTTLIITNTDSGGINASDTLTKISGTGPTNPAYTSVSANRPGALRLLFDSSPANSWLLFKRGDTFNTCIMEKTYGFNWSNVDGISTVEPFLISNYDPGITYPGGECIPNPADTSLLAYPELVPRGARLWLAQVNNGRKTHWVGLNIDGTHINQITSALQRHGDVRWEDCYLHGAGGNCMAVSGDWPDNTALDLYRIILADCGGQGLDGAGYNPWTITQCIIDANAGGAAAITGGNHNIYNGGYNKPYLGSPWPGQTFDGCIISNDPANSQLRNGGTIHNNSWLLETQSHNLQNSGYDSVLSYNVYLDGVSGPVGTGAGARCAVSSGAYYQGDASNVNTILANNNICAHTTPQSSAVFEFENGTHGWTYSNNIVYDWNVGGDDTLKFHHKLPDGIKAVSFTAGSGYTPRSLAITAITSGRHGMARLEILSGATMGIPGGEGGCYVYIAGTGTSLDGNIWRIADEFGDRTLWDVQNTLLSSLTGSISITGSTKIYYPYSVSPSGGTGTSFTTDVIVGPSNTVVGLSLPGNDGAQGNPGHGYTNGDVLSTSFGGGSGCTLTVTQICTITNGGGNINSDATITGNPGLYIDPTRTAGSYLNLIESTSGKTTQDFITAARTKVRKATFNGLYLAESLNDYIRQGFGQSMLGSAFADGFIILDDTLIDGTVGTTYSGQSVTASNGTAPYTYALTSGSLPTSLSLNTSTGAITGTPTVAGTYNFRITATDSAGSPASGFRDYTVIIASAGGGVTISTTSLPNGTVGVGYSQTISATGGTGPYTFAVTSGSLPLGLSLSSGGLLSGTPTTPGSSSFSITATDSLAAASSPQAYNVTISSSAPPSILMPQICM